MLQIILTIISLIIYDIGKEGLKILIMKWNKKKLDMIIKNVGNSMKMDNEEQDYNYRWSKWI